MDLTPKWKTYLFARLSGADDEVANDQAGYEGKTPGLVIRLYQQCRKLQKMWNQWGEGEVEVRRLDDETTKRLRVLDSRIREYEIERDDLRALKRQLDLFMEWKESSRGRDDSPARREQRRPADSAGV